MSGFTLRTKEGEDKYQWAKAVNDLVPLSQEPPIQEFRYWRVIDNRFPYGTIFETHHMLLPKRIVANRHELTDEERNELEVIVEYYAQPLYDSLLENFSSRRSIHDHYHIHLGVYPEEENKNGQKEDGEPGGSEGEGED